MALLSVAKRKKYMDYLGYGKYDEKSIKRLQSDYFTRKKDIDGQYGPDTDNLLRHVYNVKRYAPNFSPKEFKCGCNGKYCTGYPNYMRKNELVHIQTIREHYGKPVTVTCGLRCKKYNSLLSGAVSNSLHVLGRAIDFFIPGVTDTLARRKKAISYIKTLPHHHYTYGNGWSSYGVAVYAPNMGNALHTDTN